MLTCQRWQNEPLRAVKSNTAKQCRCLFQSHHLNTKFSHSDIAATHSTDTPSRLLMKYVKGKTSRKAALGSPIWVTTSHIFSWLIVLCCRLSAIQMPWLWMASIPTSFLFCFIKTCNVMKVVKMQSWVNFVSFFRKCCSSACSTATCPVGGALLFEKR